MTGFMGKKKKSDYFFLSSFPPFSFLFLRDESGSRLLHIDTF